MTEGTFSNNVLSLSRPAGAINIDMSSLATKAEVQAIGVTSEGNQVTVNGKSASTVNSVSGSVSGSNLTIGVNGVNSDPIAIPNGLDITKATPSNYSTIYDYVKNAPIGSIMVGFFYADQTNKFINFSCFKNTVIAGSVIQTYGTINTINTDNNIDIFYQLSFYTDHIVMRNDSDVSDIVRNGSFIIINA